MRRDVGFGHDLCKHDVKPWRCTGIVKDYRQGVASKNAFNFCEQLGPIKAVRAPVIERFHLAARIAEPAADMIEPVGGNGVRRIVGIGGVLVVVLALKQPKKLQDIIQLWSPAKIVVQKKIKDALGLIPSRNAYQPPDV